MLETMQRRIKSALVHLQNVPGDLAYSLGDGPAVHGTERDGLEDQEVNGALDEVSRLAQLALPSVHDRKASTAPVNEQGERQDARPASAG